jgi:hypothetical protein
MDLSEIAALAKGLVPFVREAIAAEVAPLIARIAELEARPVEKGETGDRGPQGETGAEGPRGHDGPSGPPGVAGDRGPQGETGSDGPQGLRGIDGPMGPPGPTGVHGEVGPQGLRGPSGDKGEKGDPGRDGRDAADLALLRSYIVEQVAETVAETFKAASFTSPDFGRTLNATLGGISHEIKTAIPLHVGLWKENTTYFIGDGVTHGGQFFIAQVDTTAKPLTSNDWRLVVQRGRDGRDWRPPPDRPPEPVRFK